MPSVLTLVALVLYLVAAACALTDIYSLTALETLGVVAAGLACEASAKLVA